MKRFYLFAALALLICAGNASAQGVRVGNAQSAPTTTTTVLSQLVLAPVPNSNVQFCNAPANATPCSNLATTYTDATLTTPCATSTQIVLDGTNTCVASTDSLGKWGVWVAAGQYAFTFTTSAGNFGPYFVTAGASSAGASNYQTVQVGGGSLPVQPILNLVPGLGASLGCANNVPSTRTDCTFSSTVVGAPISGDNTWTTNQRFKGPIPWADVTAFGAVAQGTTVYPHTTTATPTGCVATSATVLLAATGQVNVAIFQNGNGITLYNCGAATGLGTPAGPTVTPSIAMGGTGLGGGIAGGIVVTDGTGQGASTYKYRLIGRTKYGGYTPAGAVTTITNGQGALGLQTCTVATEALSSGTLTLTTATPCYVSAGTLVHVNGSTSGDFTLWGSLATVNTGTYESFTITNYVLDSRGLGWQASDTTSGTGGTMAFYYSNHLSWAVASPAPWEYYVCTERPGDSSYHLIGQTKPSIDGWFDVMFDDYGSPYNDSQQYPSYIETSSDTPNTSDAICTGASAVADPLTTTILSGANTTTLTLNATAGTTSSGFGVTFDDAPAILAAANSISKSSGATTGGVLFFPVTINASAQQYGYPVFSYLALPSYISILQSGAIFPYETINIPPSVTWDGFWGDPQTPSFSFYGSPSISGTANPLLYATGTPHLSGATLSNGSINGGSLFICACSSLVFDSVNFVSGGGNSDYLSMNFLARSTASGGGDFIFNRSMFSGGPNQTTNKSWTPLVYFPPNQNGSSGALQGNQFYSVKCNECNFARRGFEQEEAAGNGGVFEFNWGHRQGGITPMLMLGNNNGTVDPFVKFNNFTLDTESVPMIASLSQLSGAVAPFVESSFVFSAGTDTGNSQIPPPYSGHSPLNVKQQSSATGKLPNMTGFYELPTSNAAVGKSIYFEPVLIGGPNGSLQAIGQAPALTGTGSCTTQSTQVGGAWAGSFVCTGTTGSSTVVIAPGPTAPHGWACSASDVTTSNALRQSATAATTCTIAGTVNANDVITFSAVAY